MSIDIDEAEAVLQEENGEQQAMVQEISVDISNAWCSEIHEVLNSFRANSNVTELSKVLLSGGGAFIAGFSEKLESQLDVGVSVLDPFGGLEIDEKKFSGSQIRQFGPQASIALGLAMRRVDDK